MKRRIFPVTALSLALAAGLSVTSAFAQTKWDLPAAYPWWPAMPALARYLHRLCWLRE